MRLDVTSAKMRKRLVAQLGAQRAPVDPPPLHPEAAQPKAAHAPQQLVQWAQAALSVLLGLRLPLDGVLGATTQMALRRFQGQAGVSQTGTLDAPTVAALAKAIGHPPPGAAAEHRVMPRWFRLERQGARAKAPPQPVRKSAGPDDAPQAEPSAPPPLAAKPPVAELEPHKKPRHEEVL